MIENKEKFATQNVSSLVGAQDFQKSRYSRDIMDARKGISRGILPLEYLGEIGQRH